MCEGSIWTVVNCFLFETLYFFNPRPRTCLLILERGKGRKREKERNIGWLALIWALTGDEPTPGMYLNWESNPWPSSLQEMFQPLSHIRQGCVWDTLFSWFPWLQTPPFPPVSFWRGVWKPSISPLSSGQSSPTLTPASCLTPQPLLLGRREQVPVWVKVIGPHFTSIICSPEELNVFSFFSTRPVGGRQL